jgi:TatD DNase family protein
MWFDSHCHLHICEEEERVEDVVDRARLAGVGGMLTAGIDVPSSLRSVELASMPNVHAAVGIHPNSALEFGDDTHRTVESMLSRDEVVAVGESGLDFYRDHAPPDAQEKAFEAHIELATRYAKPLIIHTRDSMDRALEMLGSARPDRFVFHCWSGDENQLRRAIDLGAYISFAGNVSFKNADALRTCAPLVPLDRLLVETDSPYLSPEPNRGKRNEPRNVAFVGEALAKARSAAPREIADATTANALAFFGLRS